MEGLEELEEVPVETMVITDSSNFAACHAVSAGGLSPLYVQIVSDKNLTDHVPGTVVAGEYSMPSGNAEALVDQLNPPIADINDIVSGLSLSGLSVVLPTYHVNLAPSPELPGDNTLVTASCRT